ncbi:MAG: D-alanine--D-alanine ligase family protein, partial [Nitrospirales bacterium]
MKKLRTLVLMHEDLIPPDTPPAGVDLASVDWKTEFDVVTTLRGMGHEVKPLGVRNDLGVIRRAIDDWKPHIAFNLLEEFDGISVYDQNVVSYLELLRIPYTGCNPRGLMLAHDKSLSKKIFSYHRIPIPEFTVFPIGRTVKRPKRLAFPLIVKSASEEASLGISQASIVDDDEKLRERVAFIHNSVGTSALV